MEKAKGARKALLSAILVIAMCVSLLAGATYALFTSEQKVNVAVTSGKVDVVATVENLKVYSDDAESTSAYNDATGTGYYFANGGFAMISSADGSLKLDRIMPMDKVTFDIRVKNNSNVKVQYRSLLKTLDDTGLFSGLDIAFGEGDTAAAFKATSYTHWTQLETNAADIVLPASVLLPKDAGNEYQDTACTLAFIVEAVQGNAQVVDDASFVTRPEKLETVLTETATADTAIVMESASSGVKATIPANAVTAGTPVNLAVSTATVKESSVVYEISLTDDQAQAIALNEKVSIDLNIGKNLKNINVNHNNVAMQAEDYAYSADTGNLTIMTATFSPFEVFFDAEYYLLRNKNTSYSSFTDAIAATAKGDTLTLLRDIADFKTADTITIPADKTFTLDMNGKSITTTADFAGRPIANLGNLTVTGNGTIDSSMSLGGFGAIRNDGDGVLTIENGTYAGHAQGDGTAIRNAATCFINGGDFTGTGAVANWGTLTINNGNFHSTSCSSCGYWAYTVQNRENGTLTFNNGTVTGVQGALSINGGHGIVNGGTFKTVGCPNKLTTNPTAAHPSHYAIYITGGESHATAEINGGTYTSFDKWAILVGNDTPVDGGTVLGADVTINDGTFQSGGTQPVMKVGTANTSVTLKGGKYCNSNVTHGAEKKTLTDYIDALYEVSLAPDSGKDWVQVVLKGSTAA